MECRSVRQMLDESCSVAGMFLDPDLHGHLETCPECRAYHDRLMELAWVFQPLDEVAMTAAEAERFDAHLQAALTDAGERGPAYATEKKLFSLARVALAAVVVLALGLASYTVTPPENSTITDRFEQLQFPRAAAEEAMPLLFVNGDSDLLPSSVDQTSAAYLTGQVEPGQVFDILDSISTEEYEWLKENLTLEM
jgi:hypothetical protein